jgi:hypothetical protein
MVGHQPRERLAGILAALDRVMQQSLGFTSAPVRHQEGIGTASPVQTVAHRLLKSVGLALRFPRFIRFRDGRTAEQATAVHEIYDMYRSAIGATSAQFERFFQVFRRGRCAQGRGELQERDIHSQHCRRRPRPKSRKEDRRQGSLNVFSRLGARNASYMLDVT